MPSHADNENEHRREHVVLALTALNGSVPSDEEVADHMAEMDSRGTHYGAFTVATSVENERSFRAEERAAENTRRETAKRAEDEARQRVESREKRKQEADDAALAARVQQDSSKTEQHNFSSPQPQQSQNEG